MLRALLKVALLFCKKYDKRQKNPIFAGSSRPIVGKMRVCKHFYKNCEEGKKGISNPGIELLRNA